MEHQCTEIDRFQRVEQQVDLLMREVHGSEGLLARTVRQEEAMKSVEHKLDDIHGVAVWILRAMIIAFALGGVSLFGAVLYLAGSLGEKLPL